LYQSLKALSENRADLIQKLQTYQAIRERLQPLRDPQTFVQPSLITRDAALNDDLSSSKRLGLRIAGQAAEINLPLNEEDSSIVDIGQMEKAKLRLALNGPS
jgi:hypothetical protein